MNQNIRGVAIILAYLATILTLGYFLGEYLCSIGLGWLAWSLTIVVLLAKLVKWLYDKKTKGERNGKSNV